MKTSCLALLLLMLTQVVALGQTYLPTDSLKQVLSQTRQDTSRVMLLAQIAHNYRFFDSDSSMVLAQQAMRLADRLNFPEGSARALTVIGETRRFRGEYPQALEDQLKALQLSKNSHYLEGEETSLGFIGTIYLDLNEYRQALHYLYQAKRMNESRSDKNLGSRWLSVIGYTYEKMNRLDSALYFQQQARAFASLFPPSYSGSSITIRLGMLQSKLGHPELALRYFQEAITSSNLTHDLLALSRAQYQMAQLYYTTHQPDSSLHYGRLAFTNSEHVSFKTIVLDASNLLVKLYEEKNNLDSAFHYQSVTIAMKDSLYGQEKFQRLQVLTLNEQQRQQALMAAQKDYQNKIRLYALLGGLAMLLVVAVILWHNNQQKQKANNLLHRQKAEIETQRDEIKLQRDQTDQALAKLRTTQNQLIQKEKLASLGELTAGIAHEIQNPLNFVNNFAEVSAELADELHQSVEEDDKPLSQELATDLRQNMNHIAQNGQRASNIVKAMLEHAKTTSGEREPTDLNALADEYLRLAYHGFRAKESSFTATLNTDFATDLPPIEMVVGDIGRVLLNLYNNALYAVQQRQQSESVAYEPTLWVSTRLVDGQSGRQTVELRVKDNGLGIPANIQEKVFNPFFTTKPTGQGTGLGLSLSYDIITKGHGGTLEVESQPGQLTEFIISLPLS